MRSMALLQNSLSVSLDLLCSEDNLRLQSLNSNLENKLNRSKIAKNAKLRIVVVEQFSHGVDAQQSQAPILGSQTQILCTWSKRTYYTSLNLDNHAR